MTSKCPAPEREEKPRVATTEPEARAMKMGDGGLRLAYNAQFGADAE